MSVLPVLSRFRTLCRSLGGLAALGMLLVSTGWLPAIGQSGIEKDLSTEKMRRIGPVYLRPYLLLKDVGYDDNVFFESGEPETDFTLTAAPGFRAIMLMRDRGGLILDEEPNYVAFRTNSDLNHWNNLARIRGIALTEPVAFLVEDRYTILRERPNTEVDRRLRETRNSIRFGAETRPQRRLGGSIFVGKEFFNYKSPVADFEDSAERLERDERSLAVSVLFRALPKTSFLVESTVRNIDFEDRDEKRDSRIYSVLPGVRFDPKGSIRGELKVGPARLDARERKESDFSGLVGEANLSSRVWGRGRLKGTFEREIIFSTLQDNLYFISTTWSGSYEHFFSRRVSTEVLYGRGLSDYPERVSRGGTQPFDGYREDLFERYGLSVNYRLNPQLRLSLRFERINRDSNDDYLDRERNFYGIGSTIEL